jgi:bacterioferritin (cytochrome b1)
MPKKNKRNTRRARKKRLTKEMMRQQIAQRKVDIEIQEDASMDSATESSDAPIIVTVTTPDGSAVSPTTFRKFFNPSSMGRLREKVFGSRKATKEEMVLRRELIKIVGSAQSTQKLIMQNMRVLEELAKSNEDVAKMLENYNDPKTKQLFEKVLTGQELFPDEVQNLVGNLQTFTTSLKEVGVALEVPLPEIVKQIGTMVGDNRIDIESRRDMIADLQQVVKASGVDSDNTKALLKISAKDLNFTEEDNTTLKKILDKLPSEVEGVKQKETFEELNKKMGS